MEVLNFAIPIAGSNGGCSRPHEASRRVRGRACSHRRRHGGQLLRVRVFLPSEGIPEVPDDEDEKNDDPFDSDSDEAGLDADDGVGRSVDEIEENLARLRRKARASAPQGFRFGADELNELYTPTHMERLRQVLRPDEGFGCVFTWNAVMHNARGLELEAWTQVAAEENLPCPSAQDIVAAEANMPEFAVQRVFKWTQDWGQTKKLVFRKAEIFNQNFDHFDFQLTNGCVEWLRSMENYGMRCCLCSSSLPREKITAVLEKKNIQLLFQQLVALEDEPVDFAEAILISCEKIQRPPFKTVVFCDTLSEVITTHEVQAKAIAILGAYKAYEMRPADTGVRSFGELSVLNVRRLFAKDTGPELEPEMQRELQ